MGDIIGLLGSCGFTLGLLVRATIWVRSEFHSLLPDQAREEAHSPRRQDRDVPTVRRRRKRGSGADPVLPLLDK